MIKNLKLMAVSSTLLTAAVQGQAQTAIANWSFDQLAVGINANPAPSSGTGTALALGMSNSYNNTTAVSNPDVLVDAGSSTGGANAWRIRGTTPGNGWSSQAPIGTQGAEFDVSTVGFSNIQLTFDAHTTTQSEANLAVLYTTDGSSWKTATLNFSGATANVLNNSTSANTVTGSYIHFATSASPWYNGITADFTTDTAANNNANFAVRLVNASTGADNVNQSGTAYNNTSGNWRFDNVAIISTPAPEPSAWAVFGLGFGALVWHLRQRRLNS